MKRSAWVLAAGFLWVGCVTATPTELIQARVAYDRARRGDAAVLAPAQLYEAQKAMEEANRQYSDHPRSREVKDLAYVALRKAERAESAARTEVAVRQAATAERSARELQRQREATLRAELEQTRQQLAAAAQAGAASAGEAAQRETRAAEELRRREAELQAELQRRERALQEREQELEQERRAREQAESSAAEVRQRLEQLAQVRDEPRGLVLTLSGSLLFPSGQATLLPSARERLDQIAEALKQGGADQRLIIEGHTDAQGSAEYNRHLSELRAQAVRDFLAGRGVPLDAFEIRGYGETRPVADNASAEGRANNRRVEIVIARERGVGGTGEPSDGR